MAKLYPAYVIWRGATPHCYIVDMIMTTHNIVDYIEDNFQQTSEYWPNYRKMYGKIFNLNWNDFLICSKDDVPYNISRYTP